MSFSELCRRTFRTLCDKGLDTLRDFEESLCCGREVCCFCRAGMGQIWSLGAYIYAIKMTHFNTYFAMYSCRL
jgi:hypothetical protein